MAIASDFSIADSISFFAFLGFRGDGTQSPSSTLLLAFLDLGGDGVQSSLSLLFLLKISPNNPFIPETNKPETVITTPKTVEKIPLSVSKNEPSESSSLSIICGADFLSGSKSGGTIEFPSLSIHNAFPALIQPRGITINVSNVEIAPPNTNDTAIPLKIGSVIITNEPPIKAKAVIAIGRVLASHECIAASTILIP